MNSKQRRKARRKRKRSGIFFGSLITRLWVEKNSIITLEDLRKALALVPGGAQ